MQEEPKNLFDAEVFEGILAVEGVEYPIVFNAKIDGACRLHLEAEPIGKDAFFALAGVRERVGELSEWLTLTGLTKDQKTRFRSDFVSCVGWKSSLSSEGTRFDIKISAVQATLEGEAGLKKCGTDGSPKSVRKFWFRGFQSIGRLSVECELGDLLIWGDMARVDPDFLSGGVAIQSKVETPGEEWPEKADRLLKYMHDGLAFAHGGRLQLARIDHYDRGRWVTTIFSGVGVKSELAVIPHLDPEPYANALVARYFSVGPIAEEFWTAVGWMHVDTTFDEIRFLSAMTAVEALIKKVVGPRSGTILEKAKFKELLVQLGKVLEQSDVPAEAKAIFLAKLAGLNQKTFSEKMRDMFAIRGISRIDFDDSALKGLTDLRNDIVHRGIIPNDRKDEVWRKIILARELIVRVILSEIGFRGRYLCYLTDGNFRDVTDWLPAANGSSPN